MRTNRIPHSIKIFAFVVLVPFIVSAHVGSPNVFFDGQAGPYRVRVIIRPPAVLPGVAQLDVRAEGVTNVSVQAALWEAGTNAAPNPVPATAVAGETNLFNATVWLLYSGSYSMHVMLEGIHGAGRATVPLSSAATKNPTMSATTIGVLTVLGLILFAGAVCFAGATARDAMLEPGAKPTRREHTRARLVTAAAVMLLAGALYAGKVRWQKMDGEFRNNALYKPQPVLATTRTNGNLRLLHLTPPVDTTGSTAWDTLVADHGKLMHLFLLRGPDFNAFAHLHPVRRDARTFENVLPPLPAGDYRLYAEVTHEDGLSQTLTANLTLSDPTGRVPQMAGASNMTNDVICQSPLQLAATAGQPFALDADDSWHMGASALSPSAPGARACRLMGGRQMIFQNAGELIENRDTSLRFVVQSSDGQPVRLQHYMGMMGHAVVRRSDGQVFTHLHPVGTISMAAQELFTRRERSTNAPSIASNANTLEPGNEVTFPYAFPRPGEYRLWVQVRTDGRVLTGVFDVNVKGQ